MTRNSILNCLIVFCSLVFATPGLTDEYLFEYTGTVFSVGGSNYDSNPLLDFKAGDVISGKFIVDLDSEDTSVGDSRNFFIYSISDFYFGSIEEVNDPLQVPNPYSYFDVRADSHVVAAYKQVGVLNSSGTGVVFDTFSFILGGGIGTFPDANIDLTTLRLEDFDLSDSRFELSRVEFNTGTSTIAVAHFNSLEVTEIGLIYRDGFEAPFEVSSTLKKKSLMRWDLAAPYQTLTQTILTAPTRLVH